MTTLQQLAALANDLDSRGLHKEADQVDELIGEMAEHEETPVEKAMDRVDAILKGIGSLKFSVVGLTTDPVIKTMPHSEKKVLNEVYEKLLDVYGLLKSFKLTIKA